MTKHQSISNKAAKKTAMARENGVEEFKKSGVRENDNVRETGFIALLVSLWRFPRFPYTSSTGSQIAPTTPGFISLPADGPIPRATQ